MTLSARNPQAFGVLVTFLGCLLFPRHAGIRLIGGDTMTVAVWRGLAAAHHRRWPCCSLPATPFPPARAFLWPSLTMILLQGWVCVLSGLDGAHLCRQRLLILATAPFCRPVRMVCPARAGGPPHACRHRRVFAGVASSPRLWGGVHLWRFLRLPQRHLHRLYYVVLRMVPQRNLLGPSLGYLDLACPTPSPRCSRSTAAIALVFASGGVMLAAGGAC